MRGDREVESHELLDLISKPNTRQSQKSFLQNLYSNLFIYGNAYILKDFYGETDDGAAVTKTPELLHSLLPPSIETYEGDLRTKFLPVKYIFNDGQLRYTYPVSSLGECRLMHLKFYNPTSMVDGLSPVTPGGFSISQNNEAAIWNYSLLANSARPSGIITIPADSPIADDTQDIADRIRDKWGSSRKAGAPIVLDGGMTFEPISLNPKDMDFKSTYDTSAKNIALAFGVPTELINVETAKYDNQRASYERLYDETVCPIVQDGTSQINNQLTNQIDNDLEFMPDMSNLEVMIEKKARQRESLNNVTFMTINEKREAMDMEPHDGGDILLTEINKIPLSQVGMLEEEVSNDDEESQ